jgi:hypothetical protein
MHKDLVVSRKRIHETEHLVPGGGVDQGIDTKEREAIIRAGFIEVGEVYAHSPFAV